MSRALVVRLSAIGDVVHALPALHALQAAGWQVGWLVEPLSAPLVDGIAGLTVIRAPSARRFEWPAAWRARRDARRFAADVAIDLQGLWKSAAWARLSGARRTLGWAGPARREPSSAWIVGTRVPPAPDAVHVIDRNLALLRELGIEAVGRREFPLPAWPDAASAVEDGLAAAHVAGPFAILNPAGGWASKLWPAESFGALARAVRERGLVPLVTWGPGEESLAERVVAASAGTAVPAWPTSLREYVELARRAAVVVAADTGPLHLACAVGAPVVALFGPTDPARNGPWRGDDEVVRVVPACAPCHRRVCPVHDGVMAGIRVDDVVAALDRRLARTGVRTEAASGAGRP